MIYLKIAGALVLFVGMASIAVRLLCWALDLDGFFCGEDGDGGDV